MSELKPCPTAKRFNHEKLEAIRSEIDLMRFMAKGLLMVCDNLDKQMRYTHDA